jgi:ligand-binding sensor protein
VQLIQETFAEVLGTMIVVTDMQGQPVTQVSNPCGLFKAISSIPQALQYCTAGWGELAQGVSLKPELTAGHLGLLGTRAFIRCGTALQGMVFIGGIAPLVWPPDRQAVEQLATQLGFTVEDLTPILADVFYLDEAQKAMTLATVQRIADILSHIVAERTALTGKLESIAKLINFEETLS